MTIYQKAIKVRKVCENTIDCVGRCPYFDDCATEKTISFLPENFKIEIVAKVIKEEKWEVD